MNKTLDIKKKTHNLKLLYVEDDEFSRDQMIPIFSILFDYFVVAVDGLEGWEKYKSENFDLVITDIKMPNMDGIELLKKIKKSNSNQKVIIVSAYNSGVYLLKAIREGVDDFILKPIEHSQFNLAIEKIAIAIHNENLQFIYHEELEKEVENKTQELMQQAVRDTLTGLYNRFKLHLELSKQGKKVIVLIDVDNFDTINTCYGYKNGDLILNEIAKFLNMNLHDEAMLFRLGHDEFSFLFKNSTLKEVHDYTIKLKELIAQKPIMYQDIVVNFTATIALAEGEKDLLRDVHIAFNETRSIGKNRIGIYKYNHLVEEKQKQIQLNMKILRYVLDNDCVIPYFQPIVNNKTKKIEKYECLARIKYNNEILLPYFFIETASLMGVLSDITRIMIDKSFAHFQDMEEQFSINISEVDLNNLYLKDYLVQKSKKYSINPNRVVLEVLESVSTIGAQKSLEQLIELKQLGFKLSIDDFGAQNSNFERVHSLKVDFIKIDGSFIKNIDKDQNSYYVAKTISIFSKSIGAIVIAEYVHSKEVYEKVCELSIEYSQGYYFSEPLEST